MPPVSYISLRFVFFIETGPVGHPLEFDPPKPANPTRFLSVTVGDIFYRPREKKPAKVLKNPVSDSDPIVVSVLYICSSTCAGSRQLCLLALSHSDRRVLLALRLCAG